MHTPLHGSCLKVFLILIEDTPVNPWSVVAFSNGILRRSGLPKLYLLPQNGIEVEENLPCIENSTTLSIEIDVVPCNKPQVNLKVVEF